MAIDATTPRTRRAVLVGGLAVAAAGSLGRAQPVAAGAYDVVLGSFHSATHLTGIGNTTTNGTAFEGAGSGTGVFGYANNDANSVGLRGTSPTGRGGRFQGKKAQIRLDPSTANSHPSSGAARDLFLDKNKRLWFCKGGTTWKQLA
jgi:hypothetical protein